MKKSHLHLIPRTSAPLNLSMARPNNQVMNPEAILPSKKEEKVQIIQQPLDFQQLRSKSNVAYSIFSERMIRMPIH